MSAPDRPDQIPRERVEVRVGCGCFDIHDEIEGLVPEAERRAVPPVNFTDPAPRTVPDVGFPDLPGGGDADPRMSKAVREAEDDAETAELFDARFVGPKKVSPIREPFLPG